MFKIFDSVQKLDILGTHFSQINNQNQKLGNPAMENILNNKYKVIKKGFVSNGINNHTVCVFREDNPAHDPKETDEIPYYFTRYEKVKKNSNI